MHLQTFGCLSRQLDTRSRDGNAKFTAQRGKRLLVLEIGGLVDRQPLFQREFLQGVERLPLLVGRAVDGDDLVETPYDRCNCQMLLELYPS